MSWIYTRVGDFVIRYDAMTRAIQATNGVKHYASRLEARSDAATYVAGKTGSAEIHSSATLTKDGELQVSFSQGYEGLEMQPASLTLVITHEQFDAISWALDLSDQCAGLRINVAEQAQVIGEQDRRMEEMTETKTQHDRDLLERVTAVLNARIIGGQMPQVTVKGETAENDELPPEATLASGLSGDALVKDEPESPSIGRPHPSRAQDLTKISAASDGPSSAEVDEATGVPASPRTPVQTDDDATTDSGLD